MGLFVSALVIGLTLGTIYGLMAFGMVASYRISRVINLGQAGIAAFGATLYWWMATQYGAPIVVSILSAILVGAAMGAVLGVINLGTASWSRGIVMILTLVVTLLLFALCDLILPNWNTAPPPVFGGAGFNFAFTFISEDQIGSFITCILVAIVTTMVLRRTRFGLFVRAIYDDPDGAATVGVPMTAYVVGVWAIAGALAGLAGILVTTRTQLDSPLLLFVMVWELAGAALGGLESFALAFFGGMLLGTAEGLLGSMLAGSLGPGLENLGALLIMAAGVVYAGRRRHHLAHLQT